jgi:hypothetical protein
VARIDVCNGDADGLCAALQWRLHAGSPDRLLTGLKRDIELLSRVWAERGDEVNVFDISLARNHEALSRLLDAGVAVRYVDHHAVGELPVHVGLEAHVDTVSDTCTSLIVDAMLGGACRAWALVGAYGDNLIPQADALAAVSGINAADQMRLRELGESINYNAYGEDEVDLCVAPARLYTIMARYPDPRAFLTHEGLAERMAALRRADLARALAVPPQWQGVHGSLIMLPNETWSRRVMGSLANELANAQATRAHAVLKPLRTGGYVVSVRAPLTQPHGADALCRAFGGNGRARAGGIDVLQAADLDHFAQAFDRSDWVAASA